MGTGATRITRERLDVLLGIAARGMLALPPPVLSRLAGPEKRNDRGARLDRQTQALLALGERLGLPHTHELSVEEARAETLRKARVVSRHPVELPRVENRFFPGPDGPVPLRIYAPRTGGDPLPVLTYFHGGGFVTGSPDSHDAACRETARAADCLVVSVDYRLAPEHRFPAAVEDAVAAFEWVAGHAAELGGDPGRIAVGGDSAGGNLATVLSIAARDAGGPQPLFQVLVYPATDMTRSFPSHRLFQTGYFLEEETITWFLDRYLRDASDERDPRASPYFAEDLRDLPPALVVTAGFDPLRDEGEAYAARLREAGVPVDERCEGDLVHGFFNMGSVSRAAATANADIHRAVRHALHGRGPVA